MLHSLLPSFDLFSQAPFPDTMPSVWLWAGNGFPCGSSYQNGGVNHYGPGRGSHLWNGANEWLEWWDFLLCKRQITGEPSWVCWLPSSSFYHCIISLFFTHSVSKKSYNKITIMTVYLLFLTSFRDLECLKLKYIWYLDLWLIFAAYIDQYLIKAIMELCDPNIFVCFRM